MWTRFWHGPDAHHHPVTISSSSKRRASHAEKQQQQEAEADEATALLLQVNTTAVEEDDDEATKKQLQLGRGYSDDDLPEVWTFSRRMATYLSRFSWYYPAASVASAAAAIVSSSSTSSSTKDTNTTTNTNNNTAKMLHDAWGYFEHVTLPRHFISTPRGTTKYNELLDDNKEKAQPGESYRPTKLYSVWGTREHDLADFGIGVGLYFFTLRALAMIFVVAGMINLPSMLYYASTAYNDDARGNLHFILRASAICTDQRWAPCPSCRWHDWDTFPRKYDRYAQTLEFSKNTNTHVVTEQRLQFIKVNSCSFGYTLGFYSLISVLFLAIALYILCFVILRKREIILDEQAQTAQDYSIRVINPPPDASDAEEWKAFFSQFGVGNGDVGNSDEPTMPSDTDKDKDQQRQHDNKNDHHVVTCCTVGLENEVLVRALVERRRLLIQLETFMKPGVEFNKLDLEHAVKNAIPSHQPSRWKKLLLGSLSASDIRDKIRLLDEEIEELSKQTYEVADVFVTFENERAQRKALESLSLSYLDPILHRFGKPVVPKQYLFRGQHLLNIEEAPEPSAVRWQEFDTTLSMQIIQRICTGVLLFLSILASTALIKYCRYRYGVTAGALMISMLNCMVPYLCKAITSLESHAEEGSKSGSRYMKITIFLFVNTALVTSLITPFTDTVSNDRSAITHSLYAIYIFELIRAPLTQLLDPAGNIYRHIVGPRTANFKRMTLLFQGTVYELSERYTDMTNVIFLTFYYGIIFPAGFFFAAATLVVHYWTDKFCILRVWKQAPEEGTRISLFCRSFLIFSLVIYVVMSSYSISGFPYDNACEDPDAVLPNEYMGEFTIHDFDNNEYHISIPHDESVYHFCNQDFPQYRPFPIFPPLPSRQPEGDEWMDPDQEVITQFFGWTSVAVIVYVLGIFVVRIIIPAFRGLFSNMYEPTGKPSHLGFSEIEGISAYVPQVLIAEDNFPLIVCDISQVDPELLGWNDPYSGVEVHNLLNDIPDLASRGYVFSTVHHWPPAKR